MNKRMFIAVRPDKGTAVKIAESDTRLLGTLKKARFIGENNLHITLKFLGNVEEEQIPELKKVLEKAAAGVSPFTVETAGYGLFGRKPKAVLWQGISTPGGELFSLAHAIDKMCRELGFKEETRPFRPHLTLARGVELSNRGKQGFPTGRRFTFVVTGLDLMESRPHKKGVTYLVSERVQFTDSTEKSSETT